MPQDAVVFGERAMIRRYSAVLRALLMIVDGTVALALLVLLSQARFGEAWEAVWRGLFPNPSAPALLYAVGWVMALYLVGAYRLRAQWSVRTEAAGIFRAAVWTGLGTLTLLFLADRTSVSRLFLLLLFPVQLAATIATRVAIRLAVQRLRRQGRNTRTVLILGTGARALDFARKIEEHTALGLKVIGLLGDDPPTTPCPWPYLGTLDQLENVMHAQIVDEVGICLASGDWSMVEVLAAMCEQEGKIVRIPLEVPELGSQRRFVEDLDGTAVISLVQGPDRMLALAIKRLVDMSASGAALILLSPLFLIVGTYIRLRDGSPVFFRQTRIGINGRPFLIVKFRTMVRDADAYLPALRERNEMQGPVFKMADDPRITGRGRFLRRTSLDELPQLWNVFRGDMSLVGPRPPLPREVAGYDLWHRRKLSMKPGITGLQQVEARRDPEFEQRVNLDLRYIDQWSLWLDLKIAVRTLPAVLRSEGR